MPIILFKKIIVLSSDTDLTPFDVGAYASSTTYISGGAVEKCARKIAVQIIEVAAGMLDADPGDLVLNKENVVDRKTGKEVSFAEISYHSLYSQDQFHIQADASNIADESPPPFIAQFAVVEVDIKTGRVYVVKFVSAVDCGRPINPILVDSYEETGPFSAKSVGEIAINGPAPAVRASQNRVIDCSDTVVVPGFVNTHHHFYQTLTRNLPGVHVFEQKGRRASPRFGCPDRGRDSG